MTTKLERVVTYCEELPQLKTYEPSITWSCKIRWQINTLYLLFHYANSLQKWQAGDLLWGAPTHKVIWPFNYLVSWDHVTNLKSYIFTFLILTQPMPYNPLITWLCDKLKPLYLHICNTYDLGLPPVKLQDSFDHMVMRG